MAYNKAQLKNKISVPKREYMRLKKQARAYRILAAKVFALPIRNPIDEVIEDFKETELYSEKFLADMEDGLKKSSYAKKYANQTLKKRS